MKRLTLVVSFVILLQFFFNCAFGGLAGSALLFDGTDDYVHAPYIDAYQLPVFTFEAWVYPTTDLSSSESTGHILGRGEDEISDNAGPYLNIRSESSPWGNGVGVGYEDNSDNDYVFSTDYYPPVDTWTHLAVTRSSDGQLSIYSNENLLSQWDSTATPTSNCFQELTIGSLWADGGTMILKGFFTGAIDEVRVWNVARSDVEIAANYNRLIDPASPGLIGYWNFDDGFGTTASDLTGNNNATLGLDGTGSDVPSWIDSTTPIP